MVGGDGPISRSPNSPFAQHKILPFILGSHLFYSSKINVMPRTDKSFTLAVYRRCWNAGFTFFLEVFNVFVNFLSTENILQS